MIFHGFTFKNRVELLREFVTMNIYENGKIRKQIELQYCYLYHYKYKNLLLKYLFKYWN